MRLTSFSLVSSLFVVACATSAEDVEPAPAAAPEIKADGGDAADRGCQIVLRTLGQPSGLPSNYADGANWVVFEGMVDVAEGADGVPAAVFASRSTNGWWKVDAEPVAGGQPGYHQYRFVLDRKTVPMGDNTSWRNMRIEVIPYLEGADGSRLFDHNRYPGDYDNYVLTAWESRYGDDPAVCH